MYQSMRWLLIAAVLLLPVVAYAAPPATAARDVNVDLPPRTEPIEISSGMLRGTVEGDEGDLHVFKGIPFAAPPVGDLRWRPPQPAASWDGVRECFEFGNASAQKPSPLTESFPGMKLDAATSEDCLYLNIWAPAEASDEPRPVMVWIHGGGYEMGAGSQGLYNGANLARKGVVVVTINYRLGGLGYLAHPALSRESAKGVSGNYGVLDQIQSLKWVQENIKAFGGDPNRVTIFGESAGGGSVFALLCSPLAKGLFHRAISESGPALNWSHLGDSNFGYPAAEKDGAEMVANLGIDDGENAAAALRALDVDSLLEMTANEERPATIDFRTAILRMAPIVDGWVIPDDPMTIFKQGKQNDVPLIIGCNRDEATMFTMTTRLPTTPEAFTESITSQFDAHAEAFNAVYPVTDRKSIRKAVNALFGDLVFVAPARFVARNMGNVPSQAYLYHFNKVPPGTSGMMLGAHHGAEIPYVFGQMDLAPKITDDDLRTTETMMDYWVHFAATGNPNRKGLPAWPAYDAESDGWLRIDGKRIEATTGVRKQQLDVVDAFMSQWRHQ